MDSETKVVEAKDVSAAAAAADGANKHTGECGKKEPEMHRIFLVGTLSYSGRNRQRPVRRHIIRGKWKYGCGKVSCDNCAPNQPFTLYRAISPYEDLKELPKDGEFNGSFNMQEAVETSEGRKRVCENWTIKERVNFTFKKKDGKDGIYVVNGTGANAYFGSFELFGTATKNTGEDGGHPTYSISVQKDYIDLDDVEEETSAEKRKAPTSNGGEARKGANNVDGKNSGKSPVATTPASNIESSRKMAEGKIGITKRKNPQTNNGSTKKARKPEETCADLLQEQCLMFTGALDDWENRCYWANILKQEIEQKEKQVEITRATLPSSDFQENSLSKSTAQLTEPATKPEESASKPSTESSGDPNPNPNPSISRIPRVDDSDDIHFDPKKTKGQGKPAGGGNLLVNGEAQEGGGAKQGGNGMAEGGGPGRPKGKEPMTIDSSPGEARKPKEVAADAPGAEANLQPDALAQPNNQVLQPQAVHLELGEKGNLLSVAVNTFGLDRSGRRTSSASNMRPSKVVKTNEEVPIDQRKMPPELIAPAATKELAPLDESAGETLPASDNSLHLANCQQDSIECLDVKKEAVAANKDKQPTARVNSTQDRHPQVDNQGPRNCVEQGERSDNCQGVEQNVSIARDSGFPPPAVATHGMEEQSVDYSNGGSSNPINQEESDVDDEGIEYTFFRIVIENKTTPYIVRLPQCQKHTFKDLRLKIKKVEDLLKINYPWDFMLNEHTHVPLPFEATWRVKDFGLMANVDAGAWENPHCISIKKVDREN